MVNEKTKTLSVRGDYSALLKEVKDRIRSAQYEALRAVNKELTSLYWDIGRMITERQKKKGWGQSVVEKLAADLQKEFPGVRGFSAQNLWYMRQLYCTYSAKPNLQSLVGEISWAKHLVVMGCCKDDLEREFYIRMTRKYGWTKDVLIHQIENQSYEKMLLGQTNFDKAVPAKIRDQAKLAVKDEYTFDFLELGEEHSERELERAIIGRVEGFLKEMGGRFAFLGSQYRLEIGKEEYLIDLLLYHRGLKCLVAVELKIGAFKPEYIGKMQFYLAALDDIVRMPAENPSIGMILCKSKERSIVEYALKESNKPIGVSTYRIVKKLPANLKGELPEPRQIEALLKGIDIVRKK
jgi:predicted nuclease of restriction endonuclease-like (RecB) superfamily